MTSCPQCGTTQADGERCPHCGALLGAVVEVLSTSETAAVPILRSVLEGAEIPFFTQGESAMGLQLPADLLAPSLMQPKGRVRFFVAAEHADDARRLLTPIDGDAAES